MQFACKLQTDIAIWQIVHFVIWHCKLRKLRKLQINSKHTLSPIPHIGAITLSLSWYCGYCNLHANCNWHCNLTICNLTCKLQTDIAIWQIVHFVIWHCKLQFDKLYKLRKLQINSKHTLSPIPHIGAITLSLSWYCGFNYQVAICMQIANWHCNLTNCTFCNLTLQIAQIAQIANKF